MKNLFNKSIAIIEDDGMYGALIEGYLQNLGFKNITVYQNGMSFLKELYKKPDVILLDYHLGDMDGLSVLKEVKGLYADTPVVFLSGQNTMGVAVDTLKYGAFDYIIKNDDAMERLEFVLRKVAKIEEELTHDKRMTLVRQVSIGALVGAAILSLIISKGLI